MKSSKKSRREAKQLFRAGFSGGVLDEGKVRQTAQILAALKPRGHVAILGHLARLVKLEQDRRSAKVESATLLTPEMQASVTANLAKGYGPGLNVTFSQNPALIGGLRVKVGSDVYDGSVQARLADLQQSF